MSDPHDNSVLAAIGPLREAGFALHWLHPRKKRPIGKEWSDAPVATLDTLRSTHARGNNLGVRLGEPSLLASGDYLHVLDFDIRVEDAAEEAWNAFAKLFPGVDPASLPCVASGSGGASRHLYFVTDRPFRSKLVATSDGKHRRFDKEANKDVWSYDWEIELFGTGKQVVLPPSIHPNTGEPYRWEREFDFDALAFGDAPRIAAAQVEALGVTEHTTFAYESREPLTYKPGQMDRDLDAIEVSDLHYDDWIRLGQALHHQFGGSEEGFDLWVKHTKRSTKFTGDKQLREMRRIKWRSFGKYRGQPVTMATVRQWAAETRLQAYAEQFDDLEAPSDDDDSDDSASSGGESSDFDDLPGGTSTSDFGSDEDSDFDALLGDDDEDDGLNDDLAALDLSPEEKKIAAETANGWRSLLHINVDEGTLKGTLHNMRLIVENDVWTVGVPAYNEFTKEIVQRGVPGIKAPKRKKAAKPVLQLTGPSWCLQDPVNGDFWTEDKDNAIRALLEAPETQGGYGIKVPDRDLRAAIDIAGRKNAFHPVREYLNTLTWDGVLRLERLFVDYLGAPDDAYHRHVARLTLIAAVTRVFEPGHKFDFMPILEGLQGKRKSTFISILAKSWFAELDGDFEDAKAMVEIMQGAWILETPELSGFARADVRHLKAFVSRRTDKVRLAYAKRAENYPRQCIFIGSTNDDRYLKDDTGGRRYWPVRCTVEEIDTDRLTGEIDQIWAEALTGYREMRAAQPRGTLPLYLADEDARVIAARHQESARVESADDALAGRISMWLDKPVSTGDMDSDGSEPRMATCLQEIWVECLGGDLKTYNQQAAQTLGRAMRLVEGWTSWGLRYSHKTFGQQRLYFRGNEREYLERIVSV